MWKFKTNLKKLTCLTDFDFSLQTRLNELLNQNKELKNTSALMERKVDELTEESGTLSSQVRIHVCLKLSFM